MQFSIEGDVISITMDVETARRVLTDIRVSYDNGDLETESGVDFVHGFIEAVGGQDG